MTTGFACCAPGDGVRRHASSSNALPQRGFSAPPPCELDMRRLVRTTLLITTVTASALGAQGAERLFYYVDREDSYRSFVAHVDQITVLGPQVYTVDSLGIVYGQLDRRVLELAKARGVKVMPLLVNEGFNQPALRRLLADSAAQARAINSLVELCRRHGYWGIQFDVENINIQDRERFTVWFTDAA